MKNVIAFLRKLKANNNREWFNAHKDEYLQAQKRFNDIVQQIIDGIAQFDDTITGLTPKECTFRIYRDVRFSKDKSPYKTHMGAYICRGGKKSGFSGYYFHVGVGGTGYPDAHMLAVGDYMCEPKVLQILREDILFDGDYFQSVIDQADKDFVLDDSFKLKKVPKGFDPTSKWADYLKYKVFCLYQEPANEIMESNNMADIIIEKCRSAKPFLDFINRAIQYVKEGNE